MGVEPAERPTARVIVLSPADRVLLFTVDMADAETGRPFWFPPGGGVEADETHEEAATRELREETGLSIEIGPCVWHRTWIGYLESTLMRADERYFLARSRTETFGEQQLTELEVRDGLRHRWWSQDELETTTDILVPRHLAALLPPLLRGEMPAEPFVVE